MEQSAQTLLSGSLMHCSMIFWALSFSGCCRGGGGEGESQVRRGQVGECGHGGGEQGEGLDAAEISSQGSHAVIGRGGQGEGGGRGGDVGSEEWSPTRCNALPLYNLTCAISSTRGPVQGGNGEGGSAHRDLRPAHVEVLGGEPHGNHPVGRR